MRYSNSLPNPATVSPPILTLQPQGCLDQATASNFQQCLDQALQQATYTVIVDLLWVDTIAPEGLAVLKSGIQRALQMNKEIAFLSPNQALCTILTAEKMKQRAIALSDLSIHAPAEFTHFLKQTRRFRQSPRYNAADRSQVEQLYQKPGRGSGSDSMLSGSLYTDVVWHNQLQAG